MARLLISADLHGNLGLCRAAGDAAARLGADVVVFAGDLCPGPGEHRLGELPRVQPDND